MPLMVIRSGRSGRIRTLKNGFGDHCDTLSPHSYRRGCQIGGERFWRPVNPTVKTLAMTGFSDDRSRGISLLSPYRVEMSEL